MVRGMTPEYTKLQFSVIDTAKELAMFAIGSGDCGNHEMLSGWLRWRLNECWHPPHHSCVKYDISVHNSASAALELYDEMMQKIHKHD